MVIKCSKGYTLIETIISLGLIFTIVFAVSALALGYSRYQTNRLERSMVQENFRYTVSIIAEEIQQLSPHQILKPIRTEVSFILELRGESNTMIRYWVKIYEDSTESQIIRSVFNTQGVEIESEPISDKIKAISHLLFTYSEGVVIFITGETANKTKVTYVSQVFPRN